MTSLMTYFLLALTVSLILTSVWRCIVPLPTWQDALRRYLKPA